MWLSSSTISSTATAARWSRRATPSTLGWDGGFDDAHSAPFPSPFVYCGARGDQEETRPHGLCGRGAILVFPVEDQSETGRRGGVRHHQRGHRPWLPYPGGGHQRRRA